MPDQSLKPPEEHHCEQEISKMDELQYEDEEIGKAAAELRHAETEVEQAIAALTSAEDDLKKARHDLEKAEHEQRHKLLVQASTTSGFWPSEGFEKVPDDQPVEVFLAKAKRELKIPDVTGWVALVDERPINTSQSYRENRLTAGCEVIIDWGPEHGGGG
jgi:hypothetical protein